MRTRPNTRIGAVPRAVLFPALAALLCAAAIAGVLWWQLKRASVVPVAGGGQSSSADAIVPADGGAAVADTGDASLLHLRKGDLFALQGDWKSAIAEYQKSVDAGGQLTALRKLAQAQLQRRDIDGARSTAAKLKRAGAREEDLLLLDAVILLRTGELADAQELLAGAGDSPQKHYGLSLLAVMQARHEDAKTELALVSGGWEPVLRSYARTIQGAYDEYALFPGSPDHHLTTLLARALAQAQECELALPMLSQVTQKQADYRDAWVLQGYCELTTERPAEALSSLETAYRIDPEKPEIQYFLARAYAAQGDHGNAVTFARYAVENGFAPAAEARRLVVREALAIGDADLALQQEDALVAAADATVETYGEYLSVAISAGKTEAAVQKGTEATQKWPEDARAFDLLGWALLESGDKAGAKTALEKALSLNPQLQSAKARRESLQ